MEFIDTHCHFNDEVYEGERDAVIARAVQAGVTRMLQADIDSGERQSMLDLCAQHPGVLFPMLGLYPGSVKEDWQEELDKVFEEAKNPERFVAIGEIGLDYHFSTEFKEQQKEALKAQLELAARLDLPVNIHLRDATDDFFSVLDSCRGLGLRGNLHAFSGSAETAARIRKYGDWSVGIGGVLTFKKAGIAEAVKNIPIEMILLETDAPYLAPTPLRGTRNESSYIPLIAAKLAELKGLSVDQVVRATTHNALNLFNKLI
ncbi:MAG: TatD family hydrolase [Bacteroidales bacterium]|nr:TatD family hydrolase [Bacteroidales bacterium]